LQGTRGAFILLTIFLAGILFMSLRRLATEMLDRFAGNTEEGKFPLDNTGAPRRNAGRDCADDSLSRERQGALPYRTEHRSRRSLHGAITLRLSTFPENGGSDVAS
jgi:hypothetical protein